MKKIRTGIAGTGYTVGIAANHVRAYQENPQSELVALYDILPGRAAQWAAEKQLDVKICASYEELLDSVDAVSLCTPNFAHVSMAIQAMRQGKHLLCEKPLGTDGEDARKALAYAKSTSTVKMIGFSYRGIPAIRLMKRHIEEGRMGEIFSYRETMGGCRIANPQVKLEWRMQEDLSGTGALADFGCHMLDLCDWLLADTAGKMTEAQGFASRMIAERDNIHTAGRGEVTNDDTATFHARLENGALASFVASRLGVLRHTLEIYGSGGMMLFRDDAPNQLEIWHKEKDGGYTGAPEIVQAPPEYITEPWFNAEVDDFLDCIQNGRQPDRDFARAVYIQDMIDKIWLSSETGASVAL